MSTVTTFALSIFEAALEAAPEVIEIITGQSKKTLKERIDRARASWTEPADTTAEDAERRQRLVRIIRGEP